MRFLVLVFIFISLGVQAQVWHAKRTILYDHPGGTDDVSFSDFISFRGALQEGSGSDLPFYSELFELSENQSEAKLSIVFPVYEEFVGNIPAQFNSLDSIDSLFCVYSKEYMRKKPYLQIKLLPFRINPVNGHFERLTGFAIRLEDSGSRSPETEIAKKAAFLENSVLATGSWYKIRVASSGIYRLSYEQISSMAVGNPANVKIYGYGGAILPEDCRKGEKDDLLPVQIYMNKGNDGVFNAGDYVLFYSPGSVDWKYDYAVGMFRHQLNLYSDNSYYFVTSGESADVVSTEDRPVVAANKFSNSFDYRAFIEEEKVNVIFSGKDWFGDVFTSQPKSFSFDTPELVSGQKVEVLAQVLGKAIDTSYIQVSYNNSIISTFAISPSNLSDYTSIFGYTQENKMQFTPVSSNIELKLKYLLPDAKREGWPDYVILNARAKLAMQSDMLEFRDFNTSSSGYITEFTLNSANSNTVVWDVSNQNSVKKIDGDLVGSDLVFKVSTESVREFVAFNQNGSFPSPVLQGKDVGIVANQNLHGPAQPDMVIICYPDFLEQANRLASYRREKAGLDVMVVTPEQVYNEFSSGTPDISAYRNFMKMLYNRAASNEELLPRYLLLFGDGSVDNKGINAGSTNYILTYESENSLNPTASYVSDDFFCLLDPGESMTSGLMDIGVGRLPVGSAEEAENMVKKLLDYELPSRMGDWRNKLCFIGDDEDSNIHMTDADGMANYVEAKYPGFNINKIYLDAYKQISGPSGQKYPDVNKAISDQVARGALIINYTGHGGTKGWAHEIILDLNEIDSWRNYDRLPLFMTATCDFSPYDDYKIKTPGEKVLLNPIGGGIALLTTTRLVYSQPNRVLNEKFYEIVFEKDKDGNNYRLGDIVEYTKNQAGSGINKRNFTLLGDPSQRLSYAEYFVYADSLNGKALSEATDTLKALRKVNISGHLEDLKGNLLTDFNGRVYPTVYDKVVLQQTLANDGGSKKTFTIRNNILYKGKTTVENGFFNFDFIVPKDINYAFGAGRLSFYAEDSLVDATGAYDGITIGGSFAEAETDLTGPEINVYMNSPTFRSDGITDENPILYVEVKDDFGVNTTGNGIGHDITAILDENTADTKLLNEYYQSSLNSYKGGIIRYPYNNLNEGHHTISVKVWDIYNNSSSGSTDFIVMKSDNLILEDLLNYPNPFSDYTNISFGHNKAGLDMDITVDIFDLNGDLVSTVKAKEVNAGFRSQDIYWDGAEARSGQGIYIYRIRAKTSDGETAEKSGKLIIKK
jgi:hypothetical protein